MCIRHPEQDVERTRWVGSDRTQKQAVVQSPLGGKPGSCGGSAPTSALGTSCRSEDCVERLRSVRSARVRAKNASIVHGRRLCVVVHTPKHHGRVPCGARAVIELCQLERHANSCRFQVHSIGRSIVNFSRLSLRSQGSDMNHRRRLVIALATGPLSGPLACFAQRQRPQVARIGVLESTSTSANQRDALVAGLRELGLMDSKDIVIEYRWAEGNYERLPGLAAELVQMKADVIVAGGGPAVLAAKQATPSIPIVMVRVGDPVGSGFVASLSQPGRNITVFPTSSERSPAST